MDVRTWLGFCVASWLISLSPGPGALQSMSAGLRVGYRRALWSLLGLELGVVALVGVIAAGVGAAIVARPAALGAVKWFGAGYLVWLGARQWMAPAAALDLTGRGAAGPVARDATPAALTLQGFLVNAGNPKGIVFLLAVLPQFIVASQPQLPQYAICTATMVVTDLIVMSGYTLLASQALRILRRPDHVRWINRIFGAVFILAGIALAVWHHGA